MLNRDEILRELITEQIRAILTTDDVLIQNILKYTGPFNFTDPRHIPDKGYVDARLGGSASPPIQITGSGTAGVYDLSSYLSGTQTIARVTVNGIGVGFDNNGSSIYDYYVTAGSSDIVRFYVLGQPLPAPPLPPAIPEIGKLIMLNNSSQTVQISYNTAPLSNLTAGNNYSVNFAGSDSFYFEFPVGTQYTMKTYDSTGTQQSTETFANPSTTVKSIGSLNASRGYLIEIIDKAYPITFGP